LALTATVSAANTTAAQWALSDMDVSSERMTLPVCGRLMTCVCHSQFQTVLPAAKMPRRRHPWLAKSWGSWYEREIAAGRATLGNDAAFDRAWREGRGMNVDTPKREHREEIQVRPFSF
jgi:hypothetical protein